jgi:pilus assembly protein CpaC
MNVSRLAAVLAVVLGTMAVPVAGAAPPQMLAPASGGFRLEVGKGRLVRLDHPATSVFIADPDIADVQVKSPMVVYLFGKSSGTTTLYAVGEHDEVLMNTDVTVRYDVARVEQAIHQLSPRSAVTVSSIDDSIVLEGTVYSAAEGDDIRKIAARFVADPKQLVNNMKVDAPNQINLRVRFAEVSRNVIKQLGINWEAVVNNGSIAFGLVSALPALFPIDAASKDARVVPTIPGDPKIGFNTQDPTQLGNVANNNLLGGIHSGSKSINALIDALDNHGLITVLAEPNLTAMSGEPASFLAGGEFPVPVPQGLGNALTIEWKKFGVSLNFVATLGADDRINLHVKPEVSQLSTSGAISINGIQVPALTTRRAETAVELGSGESFAIAGLLQNNVTQDINKYPWLGDVPVLGALFRSQAFQRNESELVIIVTPYVVHPIATASRARLPTDGYVPSSDGELLGFGNEYRQQPPKPAAPLAAKGTALVGAVGFDLE